MKKRQLIYRTTLAVTVGIVLASCRATVPYLPPPSGSSIPGLPSGTPGGSQGGSPSSSPSGSPSSSPSGNPGGSPSGGMPGGGMPSGGQSGSQSGGQSGSQGGDSGNQGGDSNSDGMPDFPTLPDFAKKRGDGEGGDGASGESGDDDGAAQREQSGGDLIDAGDSIAKTGDMLSDAASGGVSGAASAGGSEMEGASGEGTGEGVDLLGDEIRAAQDALKEAGIALQEAGQAIQTATTEEELERAEDLLSDARVAVIIAEGDLIGAKEAVLGNGGEMTPELEAVFESAENSLGKATGVLAEASTVVLTTRQAGLPELATDQASSGRLGDLEDDLDDSLGVFDGKIGDARSTVLNGAPPTTSGLPAQSTRPGASNGQQGGEEGRNQSDAQSEGQRGSASAGAQVASAKNGGGNVPENIPDGQDDDIVAQQLREAAMSESDPELQAKLWEEYARYKSGG
jgi:hypothetical protein